MIETLVPKVSKGFLPNKVDGKIQALGENILVTDMNFQARVTSSGIILPGDDGKDSGIRPRWAKVFSVGPEQKDVKEGQWILVSHGRWTRGIEVEVDGKKMSLRKVDINEILAVSDEPVIDDTMSDKVV